MVWSILFLPIVMAKLFLPYCLTNLFCQLTSSFMPILFFILFHQHTYLEKAKLNAVYSKISIYPVNKPIQLGLLLSVPNVIFLQAPEFSG